MSEELLKSTTLRQRSAAAVVDQHLHGALKTATERFAELKETGTAAITNYAELREAARSIRTHVISRLPEVLDELSVKIEAQGGRVFWATTGAEANDYVREVVQRAGARLVVKSKSMASEEIHLNAALEELGIEVVETEANGSSSSPTRRPRTLSPLRSTKRAQMLPDFSTA